ncbi:hypothetical protein D1BOALGB6SA_6099 [Olavius sp. associated proteobacterium Delta 1]|nr:hypothetical protein D1BOALGB6SA_6099 [Olavius sp. associated proteobacterium Delta 1]
MNKIKNSVTASPEPEVILIRPSIQDWGIQSYMRSITIPHGILTLAAHLISKGITVALIDEAAEQDPDNKLRQYLKKRTPVCVGISAISGKQIENGIRFSSIVRGFDQNIPIVWGGSHPTILPEMTARDPLVDIVVYGEGDLSFPELVQRLIMNKSFEDINGLCFANDANKLIKTNPAPEYNINEIPDLPYHLLKMEKYILGKKKKYITRYFEVVSSKGCSFKCSFCYNSIKQTKYSKKNLDKIMNDIRFLVDNYNIDGLSFMDENFTIDQKRIIDICLQLIKMNIKLHIRAGGRVDLFSKFDNETIEIMKKAGFYHFAFGIESGSPKTLEMMNKKITLDQIYQVIETINKNGFMATYNFMGGIPHETIAEYKKTLKLIYNIFQNSRHIIFPIMGPSYYTPFPGTVLFDQAVETGHIPPDNLGDWSNVAYINKDVDMPWISDEFKALMVKSRQVIVEINKKFTGYDASITDADLFPLKELF